MALTYRQIRDLYDTIQPGVSLPEWSAQMGSASGTDLYDSGLQDNWVKQASVGLDRLLEKTRLPQLGGEMGRSYGELFGAGDEGEAIGQGLPRGVVNFLPMLIPGGGLAMGAARLGLTGLLSGADTYTQTGSPSAGVVSGAVAASMPLIANSAEQFILKRIGGNLVKGSLAENAAFRLTGQGNPGRVEAINQLFPKNIGQGLVSQAGGQVAAAAFGELGAAAGAGLDPNAEYDFSPSSVFLNATLGQIPFAALYATKHGRAALGGDATRAAEQNLASAVQQTKFALEIRQAREAAAKLTGIESVPKATAPQPFTPEVEEEYQATLSRLRGEQKKITADPTLSPEEKLAKLTPLVQQDVAAVGTRSTPVKDEVLGSTPTAKSGRFSVIATERRNDPRSRTIFVEDVEGNPPELRGKWVNYSKGRYEDAPVDNGDGTFTYRVPESHHTVLPERRTAPAVDPAADLPTQERAARDEELFYHNQLIGEAENEFQLAQTPEQLQSAFLKLRAVQEANGFPLSDDIRMRKRMDLLAKAGVKQDKIAKAAALGETAILKRQLAKSERASQRIAEVRLADNFRAEQEERAKAGFEPELHDELTELRNLEDAISTKRSGFADELLGGELNRLYHDWAEGGRKGGFEGLRTQALEVLKTGKGLVKRPSAPALPKLDDSVEHSPLVQEMLENRIAVLDSPTAKSAFEAWPWKDEATWTNEKATFVRGVEAQATDVETWATVMQEMDPSLDEIEAREQARDFVTRPHVLQWAKEGQERMRANANMLLSFVPGAGRANAGGGFVWGLAVYDAEQNKLGKHVLPKSGLLNVAQFKNMGGRGKPLPDVEIELARTIVPEAFEGTTVNVRELFKGLKEKGPVLEVKKLGEGDRDSSVQRADEIRHQLDTIEPDWREADATGNMDQMSEQVRNLYNELVSLQRDPRSGESFARYSFLGPKSEQEMPGYVEGLVRVPKNYTDGKRPTGEGSIQYRGPHFGSEDTNVLAFFRGYEDVMPETLIFTKEGSGSKVTLNPDGTVTSQYGQPVDLGTHGFSDSYKRLLEGDYLSDREPKKAFHVIEVQRDIIKDNHDGTFSVGNDSTRYKTRAEANEAAKKLHPLFGPDIWETLALKAAIQHARDVGAEAVLLSDAETAMMTEGHDKVQPSSAWVNRKIGDWIAVPKDHPEIGWKVANVTKEGLLSRLKEDGDVLDHYTIRQVTQDDIRPEVSQEKGMRLHYDTTLPSAMRKLTGEAGERVEVGVHKGAEQSSLTGQSVEISLHPDLSTARSEARKLERAEIEAGAHNNVYVGRLNDEGQPAVFKQSRESSIGSPVFRNPNGSPKSSITGTLYPLANAFSTLDAQSGFTVADPSRVPTWLSTAEGQRVTQTIRPDLGGVGMAQFLLKSKSPETRALFKRISELFPESLRRVKLQLEAMDGEGEAWSTLARSAVVRLNPTLFLGDQARVEQVVAHELLHGLTLAELDNPTKQGLYTEFTRFRESLAAALPKELRSAYDAAIDSNWVGRYDGSNEMLHELGTNWHDQQIVYGLLNNKELIAQGFSSPEFISFMQKQKSAGKNFYHRFKDWVRRFLGFEEGSAYDEFLAKSDMLLQRGEWISSLTNYSERWFEQQGYAKPVSQAKTQQVLRLVLDSAHGTSHEILLAALDINPTIRSGEYRQTERRLTQLLQERGEDWEAMTPVMDEWGLKADQAGLDSLAQEVMAGNVDPEVFDLLPAAASRYAFARVRDMQEVLDVVRAATVEKNAGLINVAKPELLRGPVRLALKATERVLNTEAAHDDAVAQLRGLFAVSPDGLFDKVVGDPSNVPQFLSDAVEDTGEAAKGFGAWVKHVLQPVGQAARENPEAAEGLSRGWQLGANSRKMASEGLKAMGANINDPNFPITKESVADSVKALRDPRIESAADAWIYLNQQQGKKNKTGAQMLSVNDPEVRSALSHLTNTERQTVADVVTKQSVSTQWFNKQEQEKMLEIAATKGAIVANLDNGLKTSQNITLVDSMLRSILDLNDPAKAMLAQQNLLQAQQRFNNPESFMRLLKFLEGEAGVFREWKAFHDANPAFATAQRFGPWLVRYRVNGKLKLAQALSKSDARQKARDAGGTDVQLVRNTKSDDNAFPALGVDAAGLIQRITELEQNQLANIRSSVSPEAYQRLQDMAIGPQLATEAVYEGGIPGQDIPGRSLSQLPEKHPFLENHFTSIHRRANYWSRRLFSAQMEAHLTEAEIRERPDLVKMLRTHKENMLQTDPEGAQKINKFVGTWFMGFNVATAMVNMAQPFVTHVAELTSLTGKPLDSYRRVLNALSEIAGNKLGGKEWATPEHKWLEQKLTEDGELDLSMYDTDAATQESIHRNYKDAINLNKPKTLGQRLSRMADNYSNVSFMLFKQGERVNNLAATFASFDYYREQGLTQEAAFEKAVEFNHAVNYGGGRAQRPVGAFSGRGGFARGTAMLATSLQSYVLGTTFQLARYLKAGAFRPEGLTPAEVHGARRAAVQMLATQLAAAGVLGLPFASGAIALLDKAFPDLELNRRLREMIASFFQEDEEGGNTLTDMAMTGVPSMLGWDLQSRLSLGNTVPGVSEINGFQPELLAGPTASLVSKFVRGGRKLASGEGGSDLLPSPIKNLIEAGRQATGAPEKDYKDRPVFDPTPGEILGRAVGFQPKRLSDANAAQRILRQSEDNADRRVAQERSRLAELVLKGEFGTVRQTLLSSAQSGTSSNPVAEAQAVARVAEELTFPRDLRREGDTKGAAKRSRILQSFGLTPPGAVVSETDRLQFRLSVEQRLGVAARDHSGELQLAAVMDQLRVQNPSLTRLELRRRAELLLRSHGAPPTLEEPPASL